MDKTETSNMSPEEMIAHLTKLGYSVDGKNVDSQVSEITNKFVEWSQGEELDPGQVIDAYNTTYNVGLYKVASLRAAMKKAGVNALKKEGEKIMFTARFEKRVYTSYIPFWLQVDLSNVKDKDIPSLVEKYAVSK